MSISQVNPRQLQPPPDDGRGTIVQIRPERRTEAIDRLLAAAASSDPAQARRFLNFATANRVSLEHLYGRLDADGRLIATVLGVPNAGRTAMMFASRPSSPERREVVSGVIDHCCRALGDADVWLAQALLDTGDVLQRDTLAAAGFRHLALLHYMERPTRSRRRPINAPRWPEGIELVAFQPAMGDELQSVLDASYQDTLDCPGLRGLRLTADILEGHRAAGRFDPSLWTLLRVRGESVGALLLNPAADGESIELVYLGLAPPARGKGLGCALLRWGLARLADRRERTISLAVDDANAPARRLYESEGFRTTLRREAMIRPLAPNPAAHSDD